MMGRESEWEPKTLIASGSQCFFFYDYLNERRYKNRGDNLCV